MQTAQTRSDIFSRVNDLRMSKSERLRVIAYMQDGELIAEFFSRALAGVALAGHGVSSLAHGVKAAFAKPARH